MATDGNGLSGEAGTGTLTKKDFSSDQEVRWCPGCGDYAILSAVESFLPVMGVLILFDALCLVGGNFIFKQSLG